MRDRDMGLSTIDREERALTKYGCGLTDSRGGARVVHDSRITEGKNSAPSMR
jgi:hypothetical protein